MAKKKVISLTEKQLAAVESALRSIANLRSEGERAYMLRTLKAIRDQTL